MEGISLSHYEPSLAVFKFSDRDKYIIKWLHSSMYYTFNLSLKLTAWSAPLRLVCCRFEIHSCYYCKGAEHLRRLGLAECHSRHAYHCHCSKRTYCLHCVWSLEKNNDRWNIAHYPFFCREKRVVHIISLSLTSAQNIAYFGVISEAVQRSTRNLIFVTEIRAGWMVVGWGDLCFLKGT